MSLLNKKLIPRPRYMQTLRDLRDHNVIKVLTGVRRCGKSTLLLMFADELRRSGVTEAQIQFYNFEPKNDSSAGRVCARF
jgi:predicted AAA+ superfamily ATPase